MISYNIIHQGLFHFHLLSHYSVWHTSENHKHQKYWYSWDVIAFKENTQLGFGEYQSVSIKSKCSWFSESHSNY